MTLIQWFIFFLALQVIHFLGTWKLYEKAGKNKWLALVPVYNAIVFMDIIKRPKWWVILLFIPVVNLFIFAAIWVDTVACFRHDTPKDKWLAVLTLGFYIFKINYDEKTQYRPIKIKNDDSFLSAVVFAVVVATIVHTYIMQPYAIPTSSLEKSLLVGDYLLVSKFHYGAKTPTTPLAFPMVHDSLPFGGLKSYLSKPQLPSFRFPGFRKIKNNDIVVFHWPADTVYMFRDAQQRHIDKPLDKRSNYVKRCVAIAGDKLEIRDGKIYINDTLSKMPYRADLQYMYDVTTKDNQKLSKEFFKKYNITEGGVLKNKYILNLTKGKYEALLKNPIIKSVVRKNDPKDVFNKALFPHSIDYKWSKDNYGPLQIPKKGDVVPLNKKTFPLYKRLIEVYEHNDIQLDGDTVLLNGKPTDSYTIKQDYYWMMGDNRHNSEDSRYWGFVPFDHVVGTPVFIFWSWDMTAPSFGKKIKSIRWNRVMSTVAGDGERVSYRYWFLGAILLYILYGFVAKRRRK